MVGLERLSEPTTGAVPLPQLCVVAVPPPDPVGAKLKEQLAEKPMAEGTVNGTELLRPFRRTRRMGVARAPRDIAGTPGNRIGDVVVIPTEGRVVCLAVLLPGLTMGTIVGGRGGRPTQRATKNFHLLGGYGDQGVTKRDEGERRQQELVMNVICQGNLLKNSVRPRGGRGSEKWLSVRGDAVHDDWRGSLQRRGR